MSEHKMKPIWFFVGLILLIMGSIIFLTGLYEYVNPPILKTKLSEIQPGIWWGIVMISFGGTMFLKYRKGTV